MKQENGQIALVVLVIAAVVLTFGLSVSRKTVSDVKLDTDQELLKQAFDTAESGVDYYLSTGSVGYTSPDGKSVANVTAAPIGGGQSLDYGEFVAANNNANVWLVAHDETTGKIQTPIVTRYAGTNLRICVDSGFNGALRIDNIYQTGGSTAVNHTGYNFTNNYVINFVDATTAVRGSCPTGMKGVDYNVNLGNGANISMVLNLVPISTSQTGTNLSLVGEAGQSIPSQGTEINSVGKAGNTGLTMSVNRKIRVFRRYLLPQFMFDGIVSGGSIIGN